MATAMQPMEQEKAIGFKRILLAIDFSETSRHAIPYVLTLARKYSSEIFLVHATTASHEAIPLEPLPRELDRQWNEAEQQMREFVESTAIKDVPHRSLVHRGPVADVLSHAVQQEEIDLLAIGTHGRGGLKKLVLGSVAEEMLRLVPCPVMSVGQQVTSPRDGFRRILFATDFGPGAGKALPVALALAEKYHARFVLLHMVSPMPMVDAGSAGFGMPAHMSDEVLEWEAKKKQETVRKLLSLIPTDTKLDYEPEYIVGSDFAAEGILGAASTRGVDLIVMGANRASSAPAAAHIPWAVAHQVIAGAKCPVLTVRS